MKVWKYELEPGDNKIQMPSNSEPLSVGWQHDTVVMWVQVPGEPLPGSPAEVRRFLWVATGQRIYHKHTRFLGTVQDPDHFVWHIFEVLR